MDSMRRMNAYVKLNFQRCLSQGKTLVICLCLAVFFYLYFGDVRGGLMESGQKIGIMEMFLVVTNNMYTSFTIWIGFVLIICDIPYRDDGVYQYLLRTSRRSWLWGQIVYIVAITVIYFAYIFLLLLLLIVPQVTFQTAWTTTFVKMINAPFGYGISNYFSFPVSVMRQIFLNLKAEGTTILLASHNMEDIRCLCDKVYEMDAGVLTPIDGVS